MSTRSLWDSIPKNTTKLPTYDLDTGLEKLVSSPQGIGNFHKSPWFASVLGLVLDCSASIRGLPSPEEPYSKDKTMVTLCKFMTEAAAKIDDIPPVKQPQRFGNKSYRTWRDWLHSASVKLIKSLVGDGDDQGDEKEDGEYKMSSSASKELLGYFCDSFGNYQRIDYGTGHEMCFVSFLAALVNAGVLEPVTSNEKDGEEKVSVGACTKLPVDTLRALIFDVFTTYLHLVRKLQRVYWLEPAGSKGCWGLDDFQHLAFIFGAAQLVGAESALPQAIVDRHKGAEIPPLRPSVIAAPKLMKTLASDYIYFGCINYINNTKTGVFQEYASMLFDISRVSKTWTKVCYGLMRMFFDEVLSKFPVVQHIWFGKLLALKPPVKTTWKFPPPAPAKPSVRPAPKLK